MKQYKKHSTNNTKHSKYVYTYYQNTHTYTHTPTATFFKLASPNSATLFFMVRNEITHLESQERLIEPDLSAHCHCWSGCDLIRFQIKYKPNNHKILIPVAQ
jgi:hypothetical protein